LDALEIGKNVLTVYNVQHGVDNGNYKCIVQDHWGHNNSNFKFIPVLEEGQGFIKLLDESGQYKSDVMVGKKQAQFVATYKSAPEAVYEWYTPEGEVITEENDKYKLKKTANQVHLVIKNVGLADAGSYKLFGENGVTNKTVYYELVVRGSFSKVSTNLWWHLKYFFFLNR
jgi:hypothetical protein